MTEQNKRYMHLTIEKYVNAFIDIYKDDILDTDNKVYSTYSFVKNIQNDLIKKVHPDYAAYFLKYFLNKYIELIETKKEDDGYHVIFYRFNFVFNKIIPYISGSRGLYNNNKHSITRYFNEVLKTFNNNGPYKDIIKQIENEL